MIHRAALGGVTALPVISPAFAQILNKDAPVVMGHYHLNVTSV
jgi:hypothetical protein